MKTPIDPAFIPPGYQPIEFQNVEELQSLAQGKEIWESEDHRRIFTAIDGFDPRHPPIYFAFVREK